MLHATPEKHRPKSLILKAGGWKGEGMRQKGKELKLYHKNTQDGSSPILQPCVSAGQKPDCNVLYLVMPNSGLIKQFN